MTIHVFSLDSSFKVKTQQSSSRMSDPHLHLIPQGRPVYCTPRSAREKVIERNRAGEKETQREMEAEKETGRERGRERATEIEISQCSNQDSYH